MMDWKTVLNTIAPTAATILGGPLAGLAVEAIGNALGLEAPTVKKVQDALTNGQMTGDQILALKTAEQALVVRMRELDIDIERIDSADRASAREREIKTGDSWTPRVLAGGIVFGWFVVQWYLLTHLVPTEMREIVLRALGTLDMALGLVLGYYFGSSVSSRSKDEALSKAAIQR